MIVTVNWIKEHYNEFNKKYWNGELPNIKFNINRRRNSWGFAAFNYDYANNAITPDRIEMSNYYDSPEEVKICTLLHEMIHIADYTFHPEHFIQNHRRVSRHKYDAHGYWFMKECRRINAYGEHKVDNHVTKEEERVSKLSESSRKVMEFKKDKAIVCVIYGDLGINFMFKTDIYKIKTVQQKIHARRWFHMNKIEKVEFFKFDDEEIASGRSCCTRFYGWFLNDKELKNRLENIKAVKVNF